MAAFADKIDALVSEAVSSTEMDLALLEAAPEVYADFGDSVIETIADRQKVPTEGLSLAGVKLGGVVTENGRAFQIDASRKDAFKYGERTRPVYYIEADTLHSQPDDVDCWALTLDIPTTTTEAEVLDPQLQVLFALQAAQHILSDKMAERRSAVPQVGTVPSLPAPPAPPSFSAGNVSAVAPTATSIGALPTAPTLDDTDWTTYFNAEDPEMMTEALEEASASLQADLEEYKSLVQKEIQQAQIAAQEAQQTAQQETDVALQNDANSLQASVREYEQSLNQFRSEVEKVQVEIQATFQEAEAKAAQNQKRIRMMAFDLKRIRSRYKRQLESYRRLHRSHSPYRIVSTGF